MPHSPDVSFPDVSRTALALNENCQCITLDEALLDRALVDAGHTLGLEQLLASHPHLFSRTAVFVDHATLQIMAEVVAVVERVVALPAYQERVLGGAQLGFAHAFCAPLHARHVSAARGAFLGFDFHLSETGPQLIEINTNAGGGLLNSVLRKAQRACCEPVAQSLDAEVDEIHDFLAMFEQEYRQARTGARSDRPLTSIAVVDDDPASQYLYPEFLMFQRAAEARGYQSFICDARELTLASDRLAHNGRVIDLVYNRLTDFWLEQPEHALLARAFVEDLAVVTPHPRAYALYADKFRLALLSDPQALSELGVLPADRELLARHIPRTVVVTPDQREALWRERNGLFFKPQSGYGGKAAYRGDKITKRVFEQLFDQAYVAQTLVKPSQRTLQVSDGTRSLKLDIRNFAYAGRVQLVCARLYQGQTTNFRSQGGGFAPVYAV